MSFFVDEAVINVRSGKGGQGCVSFRREKFIPFGGPNGGDGGDGGSVIFIVRDNVRTLYNIKRQKHFFAHNGSPGEGKQKSGKSGEDSVIVVPPGTIIIDNETNELIKDLGNNKTPFTLITGGKGGRGNMHFATSTNQAPRYAQPGLPGQEMKIRLELKLIADVGLVGFPNTGKSTFLSVISNARPKIADYPFTTLVPNLGVVNVEHESFVVADIPGIIEGASDGLGLGLAFLKHIERTGILLYMINIETDDYLEQYDKLKLEIERYSKKLATKKHFITVTKADIENSEQKIAELKNVIGENISVISSITQLGIKQLIYKLKDAVYSNKDESI